VLCYAEKKAVVQWLSSSRWRLAPHHRLHLISFVLHFCSHHLPQTKLGALKRKERDAAQNEVRLMRLLQHPNVISVLDSFFDAGDHFCIVMEYAEHGDLQAALKKQAGRPMAEATIIKWISQLCDALVHVHARKILHRDIKSANIFLDKSDNIKLGDLGIGKALNGTNELARTVIGTPYFMSPELLLNQPYSYKSDMWAVGCLVFELCAQKPPYEARDMSGLVMKITQAPTPPLPSGYSPALNELYQALMSKAPAKRPTAAQAAVTCTMRLQGRGQLKSVPAAAAAAAIPNPAAPTPVPVMKHFLAPPMAAPVVPSKPQAAPPAPKPAPSSVNNVAAPAAPWLFVGAAAAVAAAAVDPSIHRANAPGVYRPSSAAVPAVAKAAAADENSRASKMAELQRLQNEKVAIERRRNALEQLQQEQERLRRDRSRAQVASANVYRLQQQARIAIADKLLKQPAHAPQQRPQSANHNNQAAAPVPSVRPSSAAANGIVRPPSNAGGRLSRARVNPDIMRDKQVSHASKSPGFSCFI
jgi:NIMA (never in mitosis gene a)-related kinase